MTRTASSLELLSRWISNGSESDFVAYYEALTGASERGGGLHDFIRKRLSRDRRLHEDPIELADDLLQKLMEQHIRQVGELSKVAERIHELAENLSLPARGQVFERQIKQWTQSLTDWTDKAMSFYLRCSQNQEPIDWNEEAERINQQWQPLWNEGANLLNWANPSQANIEDQDNIEDSIIEDMEDIEVIISNRERRDAIKRLIHRINQQAEQEGEVNADTSLGVTGGSQFVRDIGELLQCGSKIQIPISGFLYHRAMRLIEDHIKRASTDREHTVQDDDEKDNYPNIFQGQPDDRDQHERDALDFLTEVDILLSAPLREAKSLLDLAQTRATKAQAQAKIDKEQFKYERRVAVFERMAIDMTQEEIADALGLTRDKVRTAYKNIFILLKSLDI